MVRRNNELKGALVTGGAGLIGSHLPDLLLSEKRIVYRADAGSVRSA